MKYFLYVIALILSFFFIGSNTFAAIDLNVSPIKYEIDTQTWTTITRPATLINNGPEAFTIYTWKSDFVANGTDGTPRFVRYSELVYSDQQLSTWIDIDTDTFVIGPWESKTINFSITVPENATPGWHYGAVFFKNNASQTSTSWNVWINVDYGIIILINVEWEVVTSWEVRTPRIVYPNGWWTYWWEASGSVTLPDSVDYCPLGDFSRSNIDGTCIWWPLTRFIRDTPPEAAETNDNQQETSGTGEDDFEVVFEIPFENTWNTHIKPGGSVTLIDEDGKEIKQIWREVVINDNGAVIGEKIVDYIPINDNGGNVLPKTTRIFEWEWKWFPYKEYNDLWEQVINYWNPGEYYTKRNVGKWQYLQLWERVCERKDNKRITALINFTYTNEDWEEIEFNSAEEFDIDYIEEYVWINPFVVIPLLFFLILLLLLFFWIFILWKKQRRCKKCDTKVRKNWKICPKCKKKLKK